MHPFPPPSPISSQATPQPPVSNLHKHQSSLSIKQTNFTFSPKHQLPSSWEIVLVLHARGALHARAAHAALYVDTLPLRSL
ncbi:hypothetical protein VTL71DRAFT_7839 [Oculimacula yallundae]|uniref:Uncharacterized protein n=1 Tax=Oculimacula yallundae TaxID=86028 RepID=A0ABR4CX74_9HELO